MAYPVTLNGRTYTLADFEGTNYVDGLPDAFEDFVTHAGDIYNDTSTTSTSIGTGSKTFTVSSGKPYQAGTPLRIADAANPDTNFLDCIVTSYSGTSLVVDVFGFAGSGTIASWTVNIGGAKTVDGTLAVAQGGTGATTASDARTNLDVYSKADADSRFLNVSGEASNVTMTGDVTIGDTSGDTLTVNATATFANGVSFGDNVISGDDIDGGTISNFASTGIDDNATSTALTVTDSGIAATLTTAAQPNITSVGTLTGFTSTGIDDNATSTAITIDASENVGIGTILPTVALDVVGTAKILRNTGATNTGDQNSIVAGVTTTGVYNASYGAGLQFQITNSSGGYAGSRIVSRLNADNNTANLVFQARNYGFSDSMTLDASGNVLVGKTSDDITVAGCQLNADGALLGTRASGQPMTLNRTGTDGDVAQFRKSGTTVGNIGVINSDNLFISGSVANHAGLQFGTNAVAPMVAGASVDDVIDLGAPSERFQDLYLSGGAYLGGTGAANHLDDYEEGTFTPTVSGSTTAGTTTYLLQTGSYTKIGRMVYVNLIVQYSSATGTGSYRIGGLPFTSSNGISENYAVGSMLPSELNWTGGSSLMPLQFQNTDYIIPYYVADDAGASPQQIVNESANARITLVYQVA